MAEGLAPERSPSIRTITDPFWQAIVDRGAWIEFDDVGQGGQDGAARTLGLVLDSLEARQGPGPAVPRRWVVRPGPARRWDPRPSTGLTGSSLPALPGGACRGGRRRRPQAPSPQVLRAALVRALVTGPGLVIAHTWWLRRGAGSSRRG